MQKFGKSDRYNSYGAEMLKIKDRHEKDLVYGPTNEEMMTVIGSNVIRSYKNFPISFFTFNQNLEMK